ncbi:hypothetical protein D9M68_123220 [compost metagenome]
MLVSKNFGDLVTFTRASAGWSFSAGGVLTQVAANVPRLDYDLITLAARGLLLEEQRTNGIRNSSAAGAVAGAPGTVPTNWALNLSGGFTREVLGSGVEDGLPYVDYRITGTAASPTTIYAYFEAAGGLPTAAPGQIWTASIYMRTVGVPVGLTGVRIQVEERDGVGGFLINSPALVVATSGSSLRGSRTATTATLGNAGTVKVGLSTPILLAANVAVDVVLRVAVPQIEQGAFATSPILTTTAQVTRAADSALNSSLSSLSVNPANCTVFADFVMPPIVAGKWPGLFQFDNGTSASRAGVYVNGANGRVSFLSRNAGVDGTGIAYAGALPAAGTVVKAALRISGTDAAMSVSGGAAVSIAYTPVPGLSRLRLGQFDDLLNSSIRRFNILPVALANADLQTMSA